MKSDYVSRKRERELSPDSDSSLEIYYEAFRTYPPEIDESNAESVERTRLIELKVEELKEQRVISKNTRKRNKQNKDITKQADSKLTIETNAPRNITKNKPHSINDSLLTKPFTNNPQQFGFNEELEEDNKPLITYQIDVILDTGATFSMMPAQFDFAWTNLQQCLHTVEG